MSTRPTKLQAKFEELKDRIMIRKFSSKLGLGSKKNLAEDDVTGTDTPGTGTGATGVGDVRPGTARETKPMEIGEGEGITDVQLPSILVGRKTEDEDDLSTKKLASDSGITPVSSRGPSTNVGKRIMEPPAKLFVRPNDDVVDSTVQAGKNMPVFSACNKNTNFTRDVGTVTTPLPTTASTSSTRVLKGILKSSTPKLPVPVEVHDGMAQLPLLGKPLPLALPHLFTCDDEGKELLDNLREGLRERITAKSQLQTELSEERTNFKDLLATRECVFRRQAEELQLKNDQLKDAEAIRKAEEEKVKKLEADKTEVAKQKLLAENTNAVLEQEAAELRHKLAALRGAQAEEIERVNADMDKARELDELKANRLLQQEEARLKAGCKVKEATFAAVRNLVMNTEVEKARRQRRRRRRRGSQLALDSNSSRSRGNSTQSDSSSSSEHMTVIKAPPLATASSVKTMDSRARSEPVLRESRSPSAVANVSRVPPTSIKRLQK